MKWFVKKLPFLIALVVLSSCSLTKTGKLLRQGEIVNANYYEELNFRYVNNLILIDIQIENKTYTCVLDTGAEISLFDEKVISNLSYKNVANKKVSGSAGEKNKFSFVEIPTVNFGNVEYLSLVALSSDISHLIDFLKCEEPIHGIIGSNFMRKAKWRIDYQRQKIWISDQLASFTTLENNRLIKLNGNNAGSAYLTTSLDGVKEDYTFDTGNAGSIQSNAKTFNKLLKANKALEYTQVKGSTGITLNGIQYGVTNYTLINEMDIGGLTIPKQIVELQQNPKASSLVGNGILENYIMTIDWSENNLYLSPVIEINPDTLEAFQYTIISDRSTNTFSLENEWLQHPKKLKISQNNKITNIEGYDVTNLSEEAYCDFVNDVYPLLKEQANISLQIVNNGKKLDVILKKEKLLPK